MHPLYAPCNDVSRTVTLPVPLAGAYLMGLCEGNFCEGGSSGRAKGNGRIVLSTLADEPDGGCA